MKLKEIFKGKYGFLSGTKLFPLETKTKNGIKEHYNKIKGLDIVIASYDYGKDNVVAITKYKKRVDFWFSFSNMDEEEEVRQKKLMLLDKITSKQMLKAWVGYNLGGYKHKAKVKIFDYKAFEGLKNSYIQEEI